MTAQQRQALAQRIIVNDEYRLLYCPVPLVGNGPWIKVLYFLGTGKTLSDISRVPSKELGNRKNFVYLNSFPPAEQERGCALISNSPSPGTHSPGSPLHTNSNLRLQMHFSTDVMAKTLCESIEKTLEVM